MPTDVPPPWYDRVIDKANRVIYECSENTDVYAWEPARNFVPTPEYAEFFVEHPDSWNYDEISQAIRDYAVKQDRKAGIFYDTVPVDDGYAPLVFLREEATEDVIEHVLNLGITDDEMFSMGRSLVRNENMTSDQLIRLWDIFNEQERRGSRSAVTCRWRVISRPDVTTELLDHAVNTETVSWLLVKIMEMPCSSEVARVQAALKISNEVTPFIS